MKTIRLKKRTLSGQIALLRMEIVLLQERVLQLEYKAQASPSFGYPGSTPFVLVRDGETYPKPYIGGPWPGQQSTTTLSTPSPTISGSFKLPEEKA